MRRRLALVAIATTSMVALAFAVPLALLVRTLAVERALGGAEVAARALAPVLAGSDDAADVHAAVRLASSSTSGEVTVHLPDGSWIGPPRPRDAALEEAAQGQAARAATDDGWRVLVPVLRGDGTAVVEVVVPGAAARAGVARAWAVLAGLAIALVAGAVVVADRLGRSTVDAVHQLEAVAEELGRGELTARAAVDDPPEVVAVARSLHTLADRIRRLLAAEREAAADLSHRIRTPLMALRLDVESLPSSQARDRLAEDLDALERAVDAVIQESRRSAEERPPEVVDVTRLLRDRAAFWTVLAEDQARTFDVAVPDDPVLLLGRGDELSSAVDALLGNVFAHTPEGTGLALRLAVDGVACEITIEDDGPGLPDELVLARGVSAAGSTGLGLDIARRTAESLGGELRWGHTAAGGARVVLRLPLADLASP